MFKGKKSWPVLILGIIVFIAIGTLLIPERPEQYPPFITHSPSPTGTKAFYTLLEEELSQVNVWKKSVSEVVITEGNQTMIMIEPYSNFNSEETEAWLEWVEKGNTIILFKDNPRDMFHLQTEYIEIQETEELEEDDAGLIYSEITEEWERARITSRVRLKAAIDDRVLLKDQYGVIAIARPYGKGEIIAAEAPSWITNHHILEHDHLKLVLSIFNYANSDVLWLNEYIHGFENLPTVFELYPTAFLILFSQLFLITLLWLWYKGKRFGPIVTPREWVVRFGDEKIKALAYWNQRGGFYKEALESQEEYLRQLIQEKWNISSNLERDTWVSHVLSKLPHTMQREWVIWWKELQQLMTQQRIPIKDFLKWTKRLEQVRKEVEQK